MTRECTQDHCYDLCGLIRFLSRGIKSIQLRVNNTIKSKNANNLLSFGEFKLPRLIPALYDKKCLIRIYNIHVELNPIDTQCYRNVQIIFIYIFR